MASRELSMASNTQRVEAALEKWAREVYGKAAQKPGNAAPRSALAISLFR